MHNEKCPWVPRADPQLRDLLWLETAGATCLAWTTIGDGSQWLHESTLPCLVWAFSMRFAEPDGILHECTPAFDSGTLTQTLNSCSKSKPRHRYPVGRRLSSPIYKEESHIICLTVLGIPSKRARRYTIYGLKGVVDFGTVGTEPAQVFARPCGVDLRVYLCATAEMVQANLVERLQAKHGIAADQLFEPEEEVAS